MPAAPRVRFALLLATLPVLTIAAPQPPLALAARGQLSDRVVVGRVRTVSARLERNRFGDELIVSHLELQVDETLKGPSSSVLRVAVEGGTLGALTLAVSDLPPLHAGDRAVFFVAAGPGGEFVPHLRGHSIVRLDDGDRVVGEPIHLTDIRGAVLGAR